MRCLGARGEPAQPDDPEKGLVWAAITEQVERPGSESEWVSVVDLPRSSLAAHPWSLSSGGAKGVQEQVNRAGVRKLVEIASCGFRAITGADDVLVGEASYFRRRGLRLVRPYVTGDGVRDYIAAGPQVIFPYGLGSPEASALQLMWVYRPLRQERHRFGTPIREPDGVSWYELREYYPSRFDGGHSYLTFAFVATHNHFVVDRELRVMNRHAPVIQLREGGSEDDHLALLGVLNSSTACFWLKQVCQDEGNRGGERSTGRYAWENYFEFTGTKLEQFPLPAELPISAGRRLDSLAQALSATTPEAIATTATPTRGGLATAHTDWQHLHARMISAQEELDWTSTSATACSPTLRPRKS